MAASSASWMRKETSTQQKHAHEHTHKSDQTGEELGFVKGDHLVNLRTCETQFGGKEILRLQEIPNVFFEFTERSQKTFSFPLHKIFQKVNIEARRSQNA